MIYTNFLTNNNKQMRDINRFRNGRAQGGGWPHGNNRGVDSYGRPIREMNESRGFDDRGGRYGRPFGSRWPDDRMADRYGRPIREMNESRHADDGYVNEGMIRVLRDAEVPVKEVIQSLKRSGDSDGYSKGIKRKLRSGEFEIDTRLPAFSLPMSVYTTDEYYTFIEAVNYFRDGARTALVCTHGGVVLLLMDTHHANSTAMGVFGHGGWFRSEHHSNPWMSKDTISIKEAELSVGFREARSALDEDTIYVTGVHGAEPEA